MTTTPTGQLTDQLTAVRGELSRVDAKCSTMLGLTGAALVLLFSQAGHGPMAARTLLGLAGAVLAASTLVLLSVFRPRLGSTGFQRYAAMSPSEVRVMFSEQAPHDPDVRATRGPVCGADWIAAGDLQFLSGLVKRKYTRMRLAVDLVTAGVVLLGSAVVVAVIA